MNPGDGVMGSFLWLRHMFSLPGPFFEPWGRGYGVIFVTQAQVFAVWAINIASGVLSFREVFDSVNIFCL